MPIISRDHRHVLTGHMHRYSATYLEAPNEMQLVVKVSIPMQTTGKVMTFERLWRYDPEKDNAGIAVARHVDKMIDETNFGSVR
jgi:hypothetical protein